MERKWRSGQRSCLILKEVPSRHLFGSDTAGLNVFNTVAAGVKALEALAHHDSAESSC